MTKTLNQFLEDLMDEPFWKDGSWHLRSEATRGVYNEKLAFVLGKFGDLAPSAFDSRAAIDTFAAEAQRYAPATMAIKRSKANALFRFCIKQGAIEANPIHYVPRYRQEPDHIATADVEELARLYNRCVNLSKDESIFDRRDAAIIVFGISGARRSNIASVRLSAVERAFENPIVFNAAQMEMYVVPIWDGKQPMEVVLFDEDRAIVEAYMSVRPKTKHDLLFINLDKRGHNKRYLEPLERKALVHVRRRVCKGAGLERVITFKEMRSFVGTRAAELVDPTRAAQVLGHSSKSGDRVIRGHYHDPDKLRARKLAAQVRGEVVERAEANSLARSFFSRIQ